jgi:hypothetical protein
MDFMPAGGKTLLLGVLEKKQSNSLFTELAGPKRSTAEWSAILSAGQYGLKEKETMTLAAYLSVNMPFEPAKPDLLRPGENLAVMLPPDGRELAWNGCQSCHSFFAGYLTQDRNVEGWQNMFLSPFHREVKMTPQEREELSQYSAINMPMKMDDVPEDLRF